MAENLLYIEKDEHLAEAVAIYIERRLFDVHVASTAATASHYLSELPPDIILADPGLPDTAFIELLRTFAVAHPKIPLILISDPLYLDRLMETFQTSAMRYLGKPVNSIALDIALKHARQQISQNAKLDRWAQQLDDLEQAQSIYHQLFDEVPCYISVQNRQFRLTVTNRLFKRDFGSEIGGFCYEIYKHRETPCPECPVARTFEDGRRHQAEDVVTARSGKQYNVLIWTAPIKNEHDEITQVMEMATNITQIRQLQDHLTSLGLMLGSMSHGVKGMLTALDGGLYQLETGMEKQDEHRITKGVEQIKQSQERIQKMVSEILYYAKSRGLQFETVDLAAFVNAFVETVRPMTERADIMLNIDIADDLGQIEIDPNWFEQILRNFIENAVDACVADTNKLDHWIDFKITNAEQNMEVVFDIADNGIGMDEHARQKMFSLFFTSKGSKGTGLGLFIAHNIIRQHGGRIAVTAEYGKGSRFVIHIPRRRRMNERSAEPLLPVQE